MAYYNIKKKGGGHKLIKTKPPRSRSAYLYNPRTGVLRSGLTEVKPTKDAEDDDDAYQ